MSEVLFLKNKAFIDLLLKTKSLEQRQALLDTATPSQIRAISELCLNLLHERSGLFEAGPSRACTKVGNGTAFLCEEA